MYQKFPPTIPVSLTPQQFQQAHLGTFRSGVHAVVKPCEAHAEFVLSSQSAMPQDTSPKPGSQPPRPPARTSWVLLAQRPLPSGVLGPRAQVTGSRCVGAPPVSSPQPHILLSYRVGTGPVTPKPRGSSSCRQDSFKSVLAPGPAPYSDLLTSSARGAGSA